MSRKMHNGEMLAGEVPPISCNWGYKTSEGDSGVPEGMPEFSTITIF